MHIISSYLKKNLKSLIKFHRIHVRSTIVIRIHSYDRSSWDLRQLTIVILSGWNKKLSIKYNKKCFLGKSASNKLGNSKEHFTKNRTTYPGEGTNITLVLRFVGAVRIGTTSDKIFRWEGSSSNTSSMGSSLQEKQNFSKNL